MDRRIIYPAQVPLVEDQLYAARYAQIGLGRLAGGLYGEGTTAASGLACTAGTDLTVTIAPGQIIQTGVVDSSAYGVLPASSDPLPIQYLLNEAQTLTISAAGATYQVYATVATSDTDGAVLPFYNSANPSQTYAGPSNDGTSSPALRQSALTLGIATSVPSGAVALWTVTVPSGATAITASMISEASGAPFYPSLSGLAPWSNQPFNAALAAAFGGYPLNAIVSDATTAGLYWRSTAGSNTTTPGASGASWVRCDLYKSVPSVMTKTFTAGNFTVPGGVFLIRLRIYGAGGGGGAGGGNSTSAVSGGGGGGAGAYLDVVISVVPGNDVSWVIGSGGTAGVNNGDSGGQGGDTIIYVSGVEVARAGGGFGGKNATLGGVGAGGVGGTATVTTASGWDSHAGAGGGAAVYAGISQGWGGIGAASFGASFVQVTGSNTEGLAGNSYGCGGSGGTGTSNGGAGVQGSVTYEY